MFTKEYLKNQLAQMGILPSDTVLIHTPLKAVGPVENGPDGFIDAFCEYLSEGLFLVPTHTWANVNKDNPVYDVRTSVPCIGAVPRAAAFRPDGFRSLHPTHSIWGHGTAAEDFLTGEENAGSPAPVGFCWDRLADVDAKILLIGVTHNRNTFIHSVDERVGLADRLGPDPIPVTILDHSGRELHRPFRPHFCSRTNDVSQFYVNFEEAFLALGAQDSGQLGNAAVKILSARLCREIVAGIYRRATDDLFTDFHRIPENLYR
jgi:aminoglycoside 3-N-acetyltransferase